MLEISSPFTMVFAVILVVCVASIVNTILSHLRQFAEHRDDLEFKREMVERGLSVEEIERLMQLNSKK